MHNGKCPHPRGIFVSVGLSLSKGDIVRILPRLRCLPPDVGVANSREALAKEIKEKAASWSVAFVEVEEIDTINIYWAGILAMRRAVEGLGVVPQHLLIDAKRLKEIAIPQQAIIKGDAKSASIAAASILAKVSRDALMRTLDTRHPGYGFADHKGYPVRAHYNALAQLGACPAHRRSFGPVREVLGLPPLPPWPLASELVREDGASKIERLRGRSMAGAVTITSWTWRTARSETRRDCLQTQLLCGSCRRNRWPRP